eukprot:gnl/TRDRNA2_/TRDRNA2_155099_c0_seq3.p1 gnl/TRDRNA2_/TRDRNA2_155099_c0~~gnl/TRDRNA2_/TRDRNA2_155099_c0_seq3.p1  ORF type:complete len:128 (-),score=29.81 gnl/TRDRNA2_/TRDRNA2_155099_c0_seq3:245-628(-)
MADDKKEQLASEQAAIMAAKFEQRTLQLREYYDNHFGHQVKDTLQAIATSRPEDPTKVLGNIFAGRLSPGEASQQPRTKDTALLSLAPRQYLQVTASPALVPLLPQVYHQGSRRAVSDLGQMLLKKT